MRRSFYLEQFMLKKLFSAFLPLPICLDKRLHRGGFCSNFNAS